MSDGGNIPMTASGLRKLKDELKHLQSVERGKISREIEVARAHGDLRENAEYHAAKERQRLVEARVGMLSGRVAGWLAATAGTIAIVSAAPGPFTIVGAIVFAATGFVAIAALAVRTDTTLIYLEEFTR